MELYWDLQLDIQLASIKDISMETLMVALMAR